MQHLIPYFIVSFIYIAVAIDFWRTAKASANTASFKLHSTMIALGLVIHAGILYRDIFAAGGLQFGLSYALSAILWLTVLIYWLTDYRSHQLNSLQAFVLPPAALFVLLPAFTVQAYDAPQLDTSLLMTHIAIAVLAYSLFTFAALHAILMSIAERQLHKQENLIKLPSFPPLMVMERLLFKTITAGFVLLTFTLISGMVFSEEIFGQALQFNHKVIFSIASWLIYAGLLFGHFKYGWRGKKAIRWTLLGFLLLVLAYVGSRFVLQVLMQ